MRARYFPEIFNAADEPRAREIILTPEGPGADTDSRWAQETPYVLELVQQALQPGPNSLVLDYGCGIGRIAKAMIEASGCAVIGVDISPSMRRLAAGYVASDRFVPTSPDGLERLITAGVRVDAAIAIWVLQHCAMPIEDIGRIRRVLSPNGRFFVLNMRKRAVPAVIEPGDANPDARFVWAHDQVDVAELLRSAFRVEAEGLPDPSRTPNMADVGCYWMTLRNRAA